MKIIPVSDSQFLFIGNLFSATDVRWINIIKVDPRAVAASDQSSVA